MEKKKGSSKLKALSIFLIIIILAAVGGFTYWYSNDSRYVTLEDGKVNGSILNVSANGVGKIVEVKVTPGMKVKKGDVLVTLESNAQKIQLSQAKAALDIAKIQLDKASKAPKQDKKILENQVKMAQASYNLAKINVENTKVAAPIDGTIVQVNALAGDNAVMGQSLVSIVDFTKLQAVANVKEADQGKLKRGQTVNILIDAFPGVKFEGKVAEIGLATSSALNPLASSFSMGGSNDSGEVLPIKIDSNFNGKEVKVGMTLDAKVDVNSK